MALRLAAALVLIPLTLWIVVWAPLWLFLVFIEVFLIAALWELAGLLNQESAPAFELSLLLSVLLPLAWATWPSGALLFLAASPLAIMWRCLAGSPSSSHLLLVGSNLFLFFYLSLPFALAVVLRQTPAGFEGSNELVLVLILVWISDSAGYFVGRSLGRHKITPRLSPNKSLEGFVAAVLLPGVASLLVPLGPGHRSPVSLFALGCLVGCCAVFGDLFESFLKRGAGRKDVSGLIPGHGGVLDRIDSLLFALPGYYLLSRIGLITGLA